MQQCPRCGTELSSGDPAGLCPACLMAGAFETETVAGGWDGPFDTEVTHEESDGFGPYHILRVLGEGGMGTVFLAEQSEPIRRQVAVKVVKLGMDTSGVLARFNNERQALALMDHPNVARIYDAGATPKGRPYFAMEYIDGVPITAYCDRHRLTTQQRLRLFIPVCLAVQHAHQRGVIHRDIKPSNVLVTEQDGNPVPKVIDFGIAKAIDQRSLEFTQFTQFGQMVGTPEYMSPEQADVVAGDIDTRSDVYSLGVLLYEMLIGAVPFEAALLRQAGLAELLRIIREEAAPALSKKLTTMGRTATDMAARRQTDPATLRRQLAGDLNWITIKVLEKNRERRYASVSDLAADIRRHLENRPVLAGPPSTVYRIRKFVQRQKQAVLAMSVAVLLILLAGASVLFYQRSERRHWVREQAIPEIVKLKSENKPLAALRLMKQAQSYLPSDPELAQIAGGLTHAVSVRSSPPGASVEIKDYLSPDAPWFALGKTPLDNVSIPSGYLRWRVVKPGMREFVGAPVVEDIHGYLHDFSFQLEAAAAAPREMVAVPGGQYFSVVWSLGDLGPFNLPAFYIDRFEVTNRQYQEFVDQGGYRKREYWKEKFLRDGRELSWQEAIGLFSDTTGRRGPSTWAAGSYPTGQADYPVGGVSWYEASAYAEFAGKSLPVIAQWYLTAPSPVAKYIMPMSNFSSSPAPVGKYQGVGPWGTYDMAGNVAEWCRNESGGARYLLGGGWNTTTNEYFEPGVLPPFHRAANAGFRCVRNSAPLPAETTAERRQTIRNFAKAKPASDAVYQIYKTMYAYDRSPLNATLETVAQDSKDWRKEKVIFDAAYGKERMAMYLFLPAHAQPPYQTVVFFPSARAVDIPSSQTLTDMKFIDYVIRSGRAVAYPIYKGTYERPAPVPGPDTPSGRETLIQESKDMGRSIDYLETRADIDRNRIAFMGESMGAALGVNIAAVEARFKAVIFLDGGFASEKPLPGTDQADFLPHIKAPTLLISGKFDWIFLGKDALMRLLGTPAADKKALTLDTAHDVSEQPADLHREVVAWLDKYFGKVI
jgi:eukaryotic-like serine/threonine-protein kinase